MPEQIETTASLVLEGGGSRGVFTAGVLDFLMEKNVKFPYVVGVSAGSCNALDYVSAQPGRTRDCMVVKDKKNNYIATRQPLKSMSFLTWICYLTNIQMNCFLLILIPFLHPIQSVKW